MSNFVRHYAIFHTDDRGIPVWTRSSSKREALRYGKAVQGDVWAVNHDSDRTWDAPTFRAVGDRVRDFRIPSPPRPAWQVFVQARRDAV